MSTEEKKYTPPKWSLGILNDKETDEVPGSILLMPKAVEFNEPLGLRNEPARTSSSTLPSPYPRGHAVSTSQSRSRSSHESASRPPFVLNVEPPSASRRAEEAQGKKKSSSGFILEPQPEDSLNDPLNWNQWRRDLALISLGFFCMVGGGMTPVLAAGYKNVSESYGVSVAEVSLNTGFYMLGLGLGGVIVSPTAIIFGKRPIYLIGAIIFTITAIWCALSPNYPSLVVARIFMGISLSPCEALPSATIAEIFFLHERAYRLGIYTLLLLGGKNLVPLVSAAIIGGLSWQWVFWIVAIAGAFSWFLLFFLVPETFWDRTPRPRIHHHTRSLLSVVSRILTPGAHHNKEDQDALNAHEEAGLSDKQKTAITNLANSDAPSKGTIAQRRQQKNAHHVGFVDDPMAQIHIDRTAEEVKDGNTPGESAEIYGARTPKTGNILNAPDLSVDGSDSTVHEEETTMQEKGDLQDEHPVKPPVLHRDSWRVQPENHAPKTPELPDLHHFNSPYYNKQENDITESRQSDVESQRHTLSIPHSPHPEEVDHHSIEQGPYPSNYTHLLRTRAPKTFRETLKPWNGRLRKDNWFKAAVRPFILFAYPAILWSAAVYALSVGWLIVLSESVAVVYQNKDTYNFTALQTGLVYISPFVGGILGTAVAGKFSDLVVRFMARRNDGVYEPEFRLVMAIPVMISTCIGLMGFGWSASIFDAWIIPTILFGAISFGCSLGSTTAITFAVDSYRVYAGEALVTLNFSKNVLHGFVFSLFFTGWLESDGSKTVFLAVGGIQIAFLLTTIPMYIYGKRARMWTVRKKMMERW